MGASREPLVGRRTSTQWFTLAAVVLGLFTVLSFVLGLVAINRLADARAAVVDHNAPAVLAALRLTNALLNEETSVRGYALTGEEQALEPYRRGRGEAARALAELRAATATAGPLRTLRGTVAAVAARASEWQRDYVVPTITSVRTGGADARPRFAQGRAQFDLVRSELDRLDAQLERIRTEARDELADAASFLSAAFIAIVVVMALGIVGFVVALRAVLVRPLERVGRRVRRTAQGEFAQPIEGAGPRDVVELASDVDSMRARIVAELADVRDAHRQLDVQARELERSNAELEQFAYVASHDLQEPLRKVASFCQLLEKRYAGQLDERADQYIAFAVDGAKRMQQLINDLLAFSRVGRLGAEQTTVALDDVLRDALASLATAIEESDAKIVAGPLPRVRGEASLLAAVFQNLVGNALKFRGDEPPRVEIGAERDGDTWVVHCTDNGIGIEPDYAERIFMIFQRLHAKDVYAGTGIGLALSRKIVEYHGGRIWLDTDRSPGTTFRFTLPAIEEPE